MLLGKRLKILRTDKKLTQEELGKMINVTKVSVSGYENGNRFPDTDTLQRIADVFGVTTDYLLGRTDNPNDGNLEKKEFFVDRENAKVIQELLAEKKIDYQILRNSLGMNKSDYLEFKHGLVEITRKQAEIIEKTLGFPMGNLKSIPTIFVAGQEINLSTEEIQLFNELKKHPVLFHDLASDPEKKVKELLKLYKMKKMFLEEDDEEYGDGFGELED